MIAFITFSVHYFSDGEKWAAVPFVKKQKASTRGQAVIVSALIASLFAAQYELCLIHMLRLHFPGEP